MALKINIGKQSYPIVFGGGAFRFLGKLWNCPGTVAVFQKLSQLDNIAETGLTFEQEDIVVDVICAGIMGANKDVELPERKLVEKLVFDAEILQGVFAELMESFPNSGNVNPAIRAGKPNRKKK